MHWVVFSCFVTLEAFSDVFLSWFPFYYEVKVCIVFWLLSPMTKGSSILYKKFIHPKLSRHEQEIDEYINQAKERGYKAVIDAGTKTFDYASKFIVETAIKVSLFKLFFVTKHNAASANILKPPKFTHKKPFKATTTVIKLPTNTSRDAVDHHDREIDAVIREMTPAPSLEASDIEELMHDVYEFSDVEVEEPLRKRTRSHSRMKETSVPPAEPEPKQVKVRRGVKQVEAAKKPRRRRVIREEIEINTDDEWTNFVLIFIMFFAVWLILYN